MLIHLWMNLRRFLITKANKTSNLILVNKDYGVILIYCLIVFLVCEKDVQVCLVLRRACTYMVIML